MKNFYACNMNFGRLSQLNDLSTAKLKPHSSKNILGAKEGHCVQKPNKLVENFRFYNDIHY